MLGSLVGSRQLTKAAAHCRNTLNLGEIDVSETHDNNHVLTVRAAGGIDDVDLELPRCPVATWCPGIPRTPTAYLRRPDDNGAVFNQAGELHGNANNLRTCVGVRSYLC